MQKIYKTAIIGGGASGLMTAVELLSGKGAFNGKDVLILERADRVGKKLIATGNGQGNLTNRNFSEQFYHGNKEFIKRFIELAKEIDLESYLENFGIPLCTLKDGKMYPLSRQASSVLDIIRAFLISKGCVIETDAKVTSVTEKASVFTLNTEKGIFNAQKVVMAVGGASAKQFGTDGTSYGLAEKFGHKITKIYPSLVQLKTETAPIKGLKGLKEVARVSVIKNGKEIAQSTGDLLFTEYGVSGSSVFSVSSYLDGQGQEYVNVEFLPEMSQNSVTVLLNKRFNCAYISKEDILNGIVNKRVGQAVLKTVKEFTAQEIAYALKNFRLKVTGNLGFNYAQVTKGGVSTDKISASTYESQLQKGFYVTGEALDVDGDCGGYNVTFAFCSGILCARDIKNKFVGKN